MSTKRVIAHFMHEREEAAARSVLQNAYDTQSYVLGEVDEDAIEGLRLAGLVVQVLGEPQRPAIPRAAPLARGLAAGMELPELLGATAMAEGPIDLLTLEAEHLEEGAAPVEESFYLVSLEGPLLEEWRKTLADTGAEVLERAEGNSYVVRMTGDEANDALALPFVSGIAPYGTGHTLAGAVAAAASPGRPARLVTWDLWLHRPEDRDDVAADLLRRNLFVTGSSGRKIRVVIPDGAPATAEVAALPAVARMEEFVPPTLHNDVARELLGVDALGGATVGLTGKGQLVAVADTGIDDAHPDFGNRIAHREALGRVADTSDPHGHGTHVAGSILGDGTSSNGAFKGMAPEATLYFQSLLDANGRLGGLPVSLAELFDPAYAAGARIHNDSWGSATASRYTIDATDVDAYVADHRDLLVVISAGNEGVAEPRGNSAPGFVDWLSIGSPASCKNALTVGASRSKRTTGGLAGLTYGQGWPAVYPAPPIADSHVSGDPEAVAAFSSRGPCDDHRIKPDLVAPGTDIVSTRSSKAPLRSFWGAHANSAYAYMGGTSMAAPLVAGCAALVREYLTTKRAHQPSAALLKALLVNGTRWLTGADAIADFAELPNFHQGFGAVFLPTTIPSPLEPTLRLEFADTWHTTGRQFVQTGQRFQYRVTVGTGLPLRMCLAYTDLPARSLQNNLNLTVEEPGGTKVLGNEHLPMSLHIPDPDNNIEVVRLDTPAAGTYLIQVAAWNLLSAPQDFALVVTGDLTSGLTEV